MDETRAPQEGGNGGGLTYQEAHWVRLIGQTLREQRINPNAPWFTVRGLIHALSPLMDSRPRDADLGQLLDRMGLYANARYRRSTRGLAEALREWTKLADARIEAESVRTYTFTPGLAPHIYTIR